MMNVTSWPEPAVERQARKRQVHVQRKSSRKALPEIDTRTPSGTPLPY